MKVAVQLRGQRALLRFNCARRDRWNLRIRQLTYRLL